MYSVISLRLWLSSILISIETSIPVYTGIYNYCILLDIFMSNSNIFIKTATRERLKHLGSKGQTYDELINQLIDSTFQHYTRVSLPTSVGEPGNDLVKVSQND